MQRHIDNSCLCAYPTDKYTKPIYCSAFGLHTNLSEYSKYGDEFTISLNILNILSQYTAVKGLDSVLLCLLYSYYMCVYCRPPYRP